MTPTVVQFDPPFVVFFGDIADDTYGKTGLGLVQWRGEECIGQLRLRGCGVDAGVPDLTVAQAVGAGARSLIIGSAAVGGGIPPEWVATLCEAAAAGLDMARAQADAASQAVSIELERNRQLAGELGVCGALSWIAGRKPLEGFVGYDRLKAAREGNSAG